MTGSSLYGYQLLRPIGTGGMADIYYAENSLGKPAAVKILKLKYSDEQIVHDRFISEAKTTVKLHHPNIREIYDLGEIEGRPAILMEYLEGHSLLEVLRDQGKVDEKIALQWFRQIISGLQYAHIRGVIHRDIKPSNLFLTNDGTIKILDFGISKVKENITMTQTGQTLGTLTYMSPEQVMDPKRVDERTDIYSLGVTFYHLLTGKMPYDITTDSGYVIQKKIVEEELDLKKLPDSWKERLEVCLSKKVEKRNWGQFQESAYQAKVGGDIDKLKNIPDEDTVIATAAIKEKIPEKTPRFTWRPIPQPKPWHFVLFILIPLVGWGVWKGVPKVIESKSNKSTELMPNENIILENPYKKENSKASVMSENPLLEALYQEIGGHPDKYGEFSQVFYEDPDFRKDIYKSIGVAEDSYSEVDDRVMSGRVQSPKEENLENQALSLPKILQQAPIENNVYQVPETKPGGVLTSDYLGRGEEGTIIVPIHTTKGLAIELVPTSGEFSDPFREGYSIYAYYDLGVHTGVNLNARFDLYKHPKLRQKAFISRYKIYLGPSEEFVTSYNDLSESEKSTYYTYDDDFRDEINKASLVKFYNILGVTDELEVGYIIKGDKNARKAHK